ncbi:MAG: TolC family protein [Deltaproteobacteria bacterium]|nr:TolC family protein [Deltaproteobacteria bacterium]
MRLAQGLLVAALLAAPGVARADLLSRALGQSGGGGGTTTPPPPPPEDLSAWSGPAQAITLPDLLQHAVRNAPSLASARLDIAIAEAQIEQTYSRDDWAVRAELLVNSSRGYQAGIVFDRQTRVSFTADVFRRFAGGGTLNFHAGSTFDRGPSFASAGETTNNWTDDISVGFTQPLMRGRGRWLFDAAERRATIVRDGAVLSRRLAAIDAVQTVISAYWDLVLAERQVAITQQSLALAKERLRITTLGNEGGKIPRSEIPAVQQIIATREEDVLAGELAVLDRSIALRRATGMPIAANALGLRVPTDLVELAIKGDIADLTERAFAASPELAQLAKNDMTTQIDIEVTENGLLPRLDAALSLGPVGQDEKFGTALKNMATFKSIGVSGSLILEHNLGQENVRGRARELRAIRQKLEVNALDIRAQIAQTMARAVAQREVARRRVTLSQRAIELANENIKIETDRFNLGKSTNFDVLNRLEELRQSELRKTSALIDWHKAEAVVQALTGDILPAYGISVE